MTEWKVGQKVTMTKEALGRVVDQQILTISEVDETRGARGIVTTDDGYTWEKTSDSTLFPSGESRAKSKNGLHDLDKTEMSIRHARSDDEREVDRLTRWGTVARWQFKLCRLELPAEITDKELEAIYLATKTLSRIIVKEPTNENPRLEY